MEQLFDLRTLMMSQGLMLMATSLGFALAAVLMRQFRALPIWTAVFLLQGLGLVLSSLRGAIAPEVAVLLSNLLLFGGQVPIPFALARDLNQHFPQRRFVALSLIGVALFLYAYWVQPWTELRTVAISALGAMVYLQGSLIVRRHLHTPEALPIAWGIQIPLLVVGLVFAVGFLLSSWHVMHFPPAPEPYFGATMMAYGNPRLPLLMIGSLCIVGLAFSVILHVALRLNDELQHKANHDALTGLCNRQRFEQMASGLLARHQRRGQSCALLFMDLDHFKRVNDQHGHAAGDLVLATFADLLRKELRRSDVIARFGGEEFCALLPDTTQEQAQQIAERICETTRSLSPVWQQVPISVSTSIGLALSVAKNTGLSPLLAAADNALYAAKRAGRACVRLAT